VEKLPTNPENFVKIAQEIRPLRGVYILKLRTIFSFGATQPAPAPMGWNVVWRRNRPSRQISPLLVQHVAPVGKKILKIARVTYMPAYALVARILQVETFRLNLIRAYRLKASEQKYRW